MFHAFGVVNASLKLALGVFVSDPDDHRLLPAMSRRGRAWWSVIVRRRWGVVVVVAVEGGGVLEIARLRWSRWSDAGVSGNLGDGLADDAADGSGARRQLEGRAAVGAVH